MGKFSADETKELIVNYLRHNGPTHIPVMVGALHLPYDSTLQSAFMQLEADGLIEFDSNLCAWTAKETCHE